MMVLGNRKALTFAAGAVLLFALAAAGLSQPGRRSVSNIIAAIGGSRASVGPQASATPSPSPSLDVGQRAQTHHGWNASVLDAVEHGSITTYDQTGAVTNQATLTVYRKFPNMLRVEISGGSSPGVIGFNGTGPWESGQTSLKAGAVRDVEQWLRYSPEWLFLTRTAGAAYREPGRRVEDHIPPTPWQGAVDLAQPREYEQVEVLDLIGPATPTALIPVNRRRVTYLVDRQTSLIDAVRWLEPANPSQSAIGSGPTPGISPGISMVETRVDFGLWRDVAGVQWPFQITHWSGGKVDFQVNLTGVQLNQNPAGTLFQHP